MAFSWKHVVPWTNRSEFVQVYQDLYSYDVHRQKSAVDEIAVWKSRAMHKMSVAIESTAALTDAYLQHHHAEQTGSVQENDYQLRAMFSLALIRFVNHITEKGQNKAFAQPVHRIAQEFGIPEWIVRLRHDATHGSLPCLDVLTTGAQWALSYLQSLEDGPESEAAREEGRALRQLEGIISGQRRNCLLACLAEAGHLLTTEDQLQTYKIDQKDTLQAEPPKVPSVLINIWRSLLRLLQSRQLTGLLLQHLLKSLLSRTDVNSVHSRLLAAWLRLILLVGDPQTIPTETQKKLEELERIYQGRTKTSSPEENSGEKMDTGEEAESGKVFSVADVKDVQPAVESDEDADDIWQICTEPVDWERVAWGLVPGHTLAETCLDCGSEEQDEEIMLEDEGARSCEEEEKGSPGSMADDRDRYIPTLQWHDCVS
ncbi:hypothetical protein BaRGS_00028053 [Batillaria attramentaria]|uniref:Las1-like protein n=1 Tax=Batillaria attramentaria TaxID=370345 RepID=A0ABD0K1H8_9CAEN